MSGDEFLKSTASLLAWSVASSFGVNGMLAVLFILRNQVNAGETWQDAIRKNTYHHVEPPDVRDPSFITILQAVDRIYSGEAEDKLTNGATNWVAGEIVAKVGGMTLYK